MKSIKAIFRRGQNAKLDGQNLPDNLSRTSSITNLDAEQKLGKGAKPRKTASRDRIDKIGDGKKNDKKGITKNNNKLESGESPFPSIDSLQEEEFVQLRRQLQEMAQEKSNLALQLGEQKGQLNILQKEIQSLKSFQDESNLQLEQLTEENTALRNRLRDVAHSPLSDNEKQQLLYETHHRHHSSAPASIATNLIDEGTGGDITACPTPDWDKHSSSNVSEVSVACLQDKINQMQETHYSTNEELQATLQELTDLQRQLTELQQENERLNEEKTLMFDSLCRQTERLNDSRSEVESLKQLLYREKDEAGQYESAIEREQKLVELLKSAQEEKQSLLLKLEQANNEIQETRAGLIEKDERITQLSERVRTLESTLDAKHAEHKLIDQELAQAKDQCSGKQIEINRLTHLLDNARTKIIELEQDRALSDKSELDELLDNARKEKDSLESEVAHLKEQLAISKNEIEKLKEQVSILQEECKVTRNNARTKQSDLEYRCDKLMSEKNNLNDQLLEFQEAINELQVQSQCQAEDKRQLSAVLSETQRNLSEAEGKNMVLESELQELKKVRTEEVEEWEKFQNDLLTSVRVANDFKTEAQQDLQRMILENKSLREKERQLKSEIEKLKGDKKSKKEELVDNRNSVDMENFLGLSKRSRDRSKKAKDTVDVSPGKHDKRKAKDTADVTSGKDDRRKAKDTVDTTPGRDHKRKAKDTVDTASGKDHKTKTKDTDESLGKDDKGKAKDAVDTASGKDHKRKAKDTVDVASGKDDKNKEKKSEVVAKPVKKREKPTARSKKIKTLSVEEELLMKSLNDWYENIDKNVPEDKLTEEQKVIKKLKTLYEDDSLKSKPVAHKPKNLLAISKPLLDSVFLNPKLEEIVKDPNMPTIEEFENYDVLSINEIPELRALPEIPGRAAGVRSVDLTKLNEQKKASIIGRSKSCDDLYNLDEKHNTPILYRSAETEDLSKDVPIVFVQRESSILPSDSVSNPRYSDFAAVIDNRMRQENIEIRQETIKLSRNSSVNFETLQSILASIPSDIPEDQLNSEQKFAVRLKRALDEAERKNTLKKKRKGKKHIVISSPTADSVERNAKLKDILLNPQIQAVRRNSDTDNAGPFVKDPLRESKSYQDISFSFNVNQNNDNRSLDSTHSTLGDSYGFNRKNSQAGTFSSTEFDAETNVSSPLNLKNFNTFKETDVGDKSVLSNQAKVTDNFQLRTENQDRDLLYNETLNKRSQSTRLSGRMLRDLEQSELHEARNFQVRSFEEDDIGKNHTATVITSEEYVLVLDDSQNKSGSLDLTDIEPLTFKVRQEEEIGKNHTATVVTPEEKVAVFNENRSANITSVKTPSRFIVKHVDEDPIARRRTATVITAEKHVAVLDEAYNRNRSLTDKENPLYHKVQLVDDTFGKSHTATVFTPEEYAAVLDESYNKSLLPPSANEETPYYKVKHVDDEIRRSHAVTVIAAEKHMAVLEEAHNKNRFSYSAEPETSPCFIVKSLDEDEIDRSHTATVVTPEKHVAVLGETHNKNHISHLAKEENPPHFKVKCLEEDEIDRSHIASVITPEEHIAILDNSHDKNSFSNAANNKTPTHFKAKYLDEDVIGSQTARIITHKEHIVELDTTTEKHLFDKISNLDSAPVNFKVKSDENYIVKNHSATVILPKEYAVVLNEPKQFPDSTNNVPLVFRVESDEDEVGKSNYTTIISSPEHIAILNDSQPSSLDLTYNDTLNKKLINRQQNTENYERPFEIPDIIVDINNTSISNQETEDLTQTDCYTIDETDTTERISDPSYEEVTWDMTDQKEENPEYDYHAILKENRYGVETPLNIRLSYKDVVKEIKTKFHPNEDDSTHLEDETIAEKDTFFDEFFGIKRKSERTEPDGATSSNADDIDAEMEEIFEKYLHTPVSKVITQIGSDEDDDFEADDVKVTSATNFAILASEDDDAQVLDVEDVKNNSNEGTTEQENIQNKEDILDSSKVDIKNNSVEGTTEQEIIQIKEDILDSSKVDIKNNSVEGTTEQEIIQIKEDILDSSKVDIKNNSVEGTTEQEIIQNKEDILDSIKVEIEPNSVSEVVTEMREESPQIFSKEKDVITDKLLSDDLDKDLLLTENEKQSKQVVENVNENLSLVSNIDGTQKLPGKANIDDADNSLSEEELSLLRMLENVRYSRPLSDFNEKDLCLIEELSSRYLPKLKQSHAKVTNSPLKASSDCNKTILQPQEEIIENSEIEDYEKDSPGSLISPVLPDKENNVQDEKNRLIVKPHRKHDEILQDRESIDAENSDDFECIENKSEEPVHGHKIINVTGSTSAAPFAADEKIKILQESEDIIIVKQEFEPFQQKTNHPISERRNIESDNHHLPQISAMVAENEQTKVREKLYGDKYSVSTSAQDFHDRKSIIAFNKPRIAIPVSKGNDNEDDLTRILARMSAPSSTPKRRIEKHVKDIELKDGRPKVVLRNTDYGGVKSKLEFFSKRTAEATQQKRQSLNPHSDAVPDRRKVRSWAEHFEKRSLDTNMTYEPVYANLESLNVHRTNSVASLKIDKKPLPVPRSKNLGSVSVRNSDSSFSDIGNDTSVDEIKMSDCKIISENDTENLSQEHPGSDFNNIGKINLVDIPVYSETSRAMPEGSAKVVENEENLKIGVLGINKSEKFLEMRDGSRDNVEVKDEHENFATGAESSFSSIAVAGKFEELDITKHADDSDETTTNNESRLNLFHLETYSYDESYLSLFKSPEDKIYEDISGVKKPQKGYFNIAYLGEVSDSESCEEMSRIAEGKILEGNRSKPKIIDFVPLDDGTKPVFKKDIQSDPNYDTLEREKTFHVLNIAASTGAVRKSSSSPENKNVKAATISSSRMSFSAAKKVFETLLESNQDSTKEHENRKSKSRDSLHKNSS
ncbi:uncharacterized protein LOC108908637 isoform X2 [Anoplophora glabripennis]|uniref:uncharacterized protein LOC108908637 isoform X2 n=1 Tax=Anoplophora glabripennis TaxID=217634 RepID=UPI00087518E7|nr:uncharacterized protein LOC108908637 isoform X2 [Anoplophora glabripennis]